MKNNAGLTGQIQDTAALTQDEVQKSVKAGDIAERQGQLFRQGATPAPVGAARLRQNTEIAQDFIGGSRRPSKPSACNGTSFRGT